MRVPPVGARLRVAGALPEHEAPPVGGPVRDGPPVEPLGRRPRVELLPPVTVRFRAHAHDPRFEQFGAVGDEEVANERCEAGADEVRPADLRRGLRQAGRAAAADDVPAAVGREGDVLVVVGVAGDAGLATGGQVDAQHVGVGGLVRVRGERRDQRGATVGGEVLELTPGADDACVIDGVRAGAPHEPTDQGEPGRVARAVRPQLREPDVHPVGRDPELALVLRDRARAAGRHDDGHDPRVRAPQHARRAFHDGVVGGLHRRLQADPHQQPPVVGERDRLQQRLVERGRHATREAVHVGAVGRDREEFDAVATRDLCREDNTRAVGREPRELRQRDTARHRHGAQDDRFVAGPPSGSRHSGRAGAGHEGDGDEAEPGTPARFTRVPAPRRPTPSACGPAPAVAAPSGPAPRPR